MTTALSSHVATESHYQEKAVSFSILLTAALLGKKGVVLPEVAWCCLEDTGHMGNGGG